MTFNDTGDLLGHHSDYLARHKISHAISKKRGYTSVYSRWGGGHNGFRHWGFGAKHWVGTHMDHHNLKGALAIPLYHPGHGQRTTAQLRLDEPAERADESIQWVSPHRPPKAGPAVPFDVHPSQSLSDPARAVLPCSP